MSSDKDQWSIQLAKMFKQRDNKSPVGIVIGKVISGLPNMSVSLGDDIILDSEQLIISNHIYTNHRHNTDEYHTPIPVTIAAGDQVILMPTANQQVYAVLDKVGE